MSIAERLTQAREAGPRAQSIRSAHRELQERGVLEGSSYSTTHRYFSGETEPPVTFVEAAAEVLGVRRAWLAFGEGPMVENENSLTPVVDEGMRKFTAAAMGPGARDLVEELVRWIVLASPADNFDDVGKEIIRPLVAEILHLDSSLRQALGRPGPTPLWEHQRMSFGVLSGLLQMVPGPDEGRPVLDVVNSLRQARGKSPLPTEDDREED